MCKRCVKFAAKLRQNGVCAYLHRFAQILVQTGSLFAAVSARNILEGVSKSHSAATLARGLSYVSKQVKADDPLKAHTCTHDI